MTPAEKFAVHEEVDHAVWRAGRLAVDQFRGESEDLGLEIIDYEFGKGFVCYKIGYRFDGARVSIIGREDLTFDEIFKYVESLA
jgi:hypothetical protein